MKSFAREFLDAFEETPTAVFDTLESLITQSVIVVAATTPIGEVGRLLLEHRVPAIAVVDDDQLCGVVTRTDVLRALDTATPTAAEAMSCFVFALPARATIERAAALMAYENVGQVIVTGDRGELIGMVSALDIARHYALESGTLIDHSGPAERDT